MTYQPPKKSTYAKAAQTRAINRFDKAAQDRALAGLHPPKRHEAIEAEYTLARAKLVEMLACLTPPGKLTRGRDS